MYAASIATCGAGNLQLWATGWVSRGNRGYRKMLVMIKVLKNLSAPLWIFLLFVIVGLISSMELGGRLFSGPTHQRAFWLTWMACWVVGAVPMYYWSRGEHKKLMQVLPPSKRKLGFRLLSDRSACWTTLILAFPLSYVLLGYAYLLADALGEEKSRVSAIVVEVVASTSGRGCRLRLKLLKDGAEDQVCASGIVLGPRPVALQTVRLNGSESFLGVFLQEIQTFSFDPPPPPTDKQSCPEILLVCPT